MSAQHVINLLSDYAEGDISPAGAAKVKAHLTFCWSCRQALAETKDHMKELRATPAAAVPKGLEERVLAKVHLERERPTVIPETKRSSGWPAWFTPLRGFAFAATCALAVVVVRSIPDDGARAFKDFSFGARQKEPAAAPLRQGQPAVAPPQTAGSEFESDGGAAGTAAKSEMAVQEEKFEGKDQDAAAPADVLAKSDRALADNAAPAPEKPAPRAAGAGQAAVESPEVAAAKAAALAERREARRLRREAAKLAAQAATAGTAEEAAAEAPANVVQSLPGAKAAAAAESPMQGSRSSIQTRTELVVNSPEEWASTWKLHHAAADVVPPVPAVDFTSNQVIAIFAGEQPTAGYRIEVISVTQATWNGAPARVVRYRVAGPRPGAITAQVITHPYIFAVEPRFDGSTFFEKEPETPR